MEIGSSEWQGFIIDSARELGIQIDEAVTAQFSDYACELLTWNRKINLTAITNPRDIAIKHFVDSLAPAGCIPDGARLLDIGSGAGFPGIPLKMLKPSITINFLKHVLRILGLENIEARQIRTENLLKGTGQATSFDVIISRALSDLPPFVKSALPLLAKQGTIIAMKGKVDQKELDAVRADAPEDQYSLEVERYKLPSIRAPRSIVILKHLHCGTTHKA
jgi:16S rRNA (guanine527-N7)-methyltransferase